MRILLLCMVLSGCAFRVQIPFVDVQAGEVAPEPHVHDWFRWKFLDGCWVEICDTCDATRSMF